MDEQMKLTNKITLDLDKFSWEMVEAVAGEFIENTVDGELNEMRIYQSAGGEGYHIECEMNWWTTPEMQLLIREEFYDDPKRLKWSKIDLKQGFAWDVLFTFKKICGQWKKRKLIMTIE